MADSPNTGAGRQVLQLAGVQASTSYGIACIWGQAADGSCTKGVAGFDFGVDADGDGLADYGGVDGDGGSSALLGLDALGAGSTSGSGSGSGSKGGLGGLIDRLLRLPADVARLLFSNPREFGLLAAVWLLLYAPCYLGDRRRALRRLDDMEGAAA